MYLCTSQVRSAGVNYIKYCRTALTESHLLCQTLPDKPVVIFFGISINQSAGALYTATPTLPAMAKRWKPPIPPNPCATRRTVTNNQVMQELSKFRDVHGSYVHTMYHVLIFGLVFLREHTVTHTHTHTGRQLPSVLLCLQHGARTCRLVPREILSSW